MAWCYDAARIKKNIFQARGFSVFFQHFLGTQADCPYTIHLFQSFLLVPVLFAFLNTNTQNPIRLFSGSFSVFFGLTAIGKLGW